MRLSAGDPELLINVFFCIDFRIVTPSDVSTIRSFLNREPNSYKSKTSTELARIEKMLMESFVLPQLSYALGEEADQVGQISYEALLLWRTLKTILKVKAFPVLYIIDPWIFQTQQPKHVADLASVFPSVNMLNFTNQMLDFAIPYVTLMFRQMIPLQLMIAYNAEQDVLSNPRDFAVIYTKADTFDPKGAELISRLSGLGCLFKGEHFSTLIIFVSRGQEK